MSELAATEHNLQFWRIKAATMKLRGEDQTHKWEYELCLERMALFERLLDKRQAVLRLSSNIKASP